MCIFEAGEPEADECAAHRKILVGGYCHVERDGVFEALAGVSRAMCRFRRSAVADIADISVVEVRFREVLVQPVIFSGMTPESHSWRVKFSRSHMAEAKFVLENM
jgi:hypothetical protein